MALIRDFEPVRYALFYRVPLPSLENTIAELIFKEIRLDISKDIHVVELPTSSTFVKLFYDFCRLNGQLIKGYATLCNHTCKHCKRKGHVLPQYSRIPSFRSNTLVMQPRILHKKTILAYELESLLR